MLLERPPLRPPLLIGVKGGRSPAQRTLDADQQHVRCPHGRCGSLSHRPWQAAPWHRSALVSPCFRSKPRSGSVPPAVGLWIRHRSTVQLKGATAEGQPAHRQAGLYRCSSPRHQIRTARQASVRSLATCAGELLSSPATGLSCSPRRAGTPAPFPDSGRPQAAPCPGSACGGHLLTPVRLAKAVESSLFARSSGRGRLRSTSRGLSRYSWPGSRTIAARAAGTQKTMTLNSGNAPSIASFRGGSYSSGGRACEGVASLPLEVARTVSHPDANIPR